MSFDWKKKLTDREMYITKVCLLIGAIVGAIIITMVNYFWI